MAALRLPATLKSAAGDDWPQVRMGVACKRGTGSIQGSLFSDLTDLEMCVAY